MSKFVLVVYSHLFVIEDWNTFFKYVSVLALYSMNIGLRVVEKNATFTT